MLSTRFSLRMREGRSKEYQGEVTTEIRESGSSQELLRFPMGHQDRQRIDVVEDRLDIELFGLLRATYSLTGRNIFRWKFNVLGHYCEERLCRLSHERYQGRVSVKDKLVSQFRSKSPIFKTAPYVQTGKPKYIAVHHCPHQPKHKTPPSCSEQHRIGKVCQVRVVPCDPRLLNLLPKMILIERMHAVVERLFSVAKVHVHLLRHWLMRSEGECRLLLSGPHRFCLRLRVG